MGLVDLLLFVAAGALIAWLISSRSLGVFVVFLFTSFYVEHFQENPTRHLNTRKNKEA
jgi:hypothetical protein